MASKQIKIAVDMDDVLSLSTQEFIRFTNEKWGTNLTIDDYDEDWKTMWQVDRDEAHRRRDIIHTSNMLRVFDRIPKSEDVIRRLAKKHSLVILTSRPMGVQKVTAAWLEDHFKGVFDDVHHAHFYEGSIDGGLGGTKGDLAKEIDADYLIDDHPKHCFSAAKVGIPSLLFGEYAWNREYTQENVPENVFRVYAWDEIENFFSDLA